MARVDCFTSASFAYLDRARILFGTLRRHHPAWTLWLCLVDEEPAGFAWRPEDEPFDRMVRIEALGIEDLQRFKFDHDVVELCTAVKGQMLCHLLADGADKVIYLDPDIAVFNGLDPVVDLLDAHDIVLTPHQLFPDDEDGAIRDNEIASLKYGIFNLGFLAVAARAEGMRFAAWWRDRLLGYCFDDLPAGLFTDQKWCDHVPGLFDQVKILRDPGYNVASWNLSRRPVFFDDNGNLRAGDALLRFFHFTKVTWVGELMLERYGGGHIAVFELLRWYRDRLEANRMAGLPEGWWAFGQYRDGRVITRAHRVAFRHDVALREATPDPFAAGPELFRRG